MVLPVSSATAVVLPVSSATAVVLLVSSATAVVASAVVYRSHQSYCQFLKHRCCFQVLDHNFGLGAQNRKELRSSRVYMRDARHEHVVRDNRHGVVTPHNWVLDVLSLACKR